MRRRPLALALGLLFLLPVGWLLYSWVTFPSDRTPEGAYFRILRAVNRGKPEDVFAYTETAAQHACWTLRNYRKASRKRVLESYPEPERSRLAKQYEAIAAAPDGKDVFALYAEERGWIDRLRRDLSGIDHVEIEGERASVVTVRGTRYPFRRRDNGIWGLTSFTATLVADAEKAARDHKLIEQAAADYDRARQAASPKE